MSSVAHTDPFEETIVYEGALPYKVTNVEDFPLEDEIFAVYHDDERLLRASRAMSDHVLDSDEFAELAPEFVRLDEKLNLLIGLISTLVTKQIELPEKKAVRLSSRGMSVDKSPDLAVGQKVVVEVYVHQLLPKPIRMFAEIESCDSLCTAVFHGMTSTFEESLDKYLFKLNREAIAAESRS